MPAATEIRVCAIDERQLELPFASPLPPCKEVSPCPESSQSASMLAHATPMPPLPPDVQAIVDKWADLD